MLKVIRQQNNGLTEYAIYGKVNEDWFNCQLRKWQKEPYFTFCEEFILDALFYLSGQDFFELK